MSTFNQPQLNDTYKHDFSFTNEQIFGYAQLSGDTNPIHVSEEYGKQSMFGKCIVHGYFSISVFSKVYGTLLYPDGHILISQNTKYVKPIFTHVDYYAVFTILEIDTEKNRARYKNEIYEKANNELKVTGEAVLMNKIYYK